jgi:phosphatidylglycerophosphate synthase
VPTVTAPHVVKPVDGFFTTFFVSPLSVHVARAAMRAGLRPNWVTCFAFALGVGAAAAFSTGQREWLIAGAVLTYFGFFFDCVDGQLARLSGQTSARGAYLDGILDRAKEYVILAGLALGAAPDAWVLAGAALALQTTRHAIQYPNYVAEDARPTSGLGWVKRIAAFPIGERFAVVAVVTALADPETTLVVLLSCGGLALAYVIAGKLRRSDWASWAVPAAQRAVELGGIAAATALAGVAEAGYVILFCLAMWRYHQVLR